MEILPFEIEGRRYALPLTAIREVVRAVAITPLPGAPRVVEGVIEIRGELVPVMDLRAREGLPAHPVAPAEVIVVANTAERVVCFRCDSFRDPIDVASEAVRAAADVATTADHVAGIVSLPDGLVLIQDLERFLTGAEGAELDAALATREGTS
jgi:purine-binding chemotaxis protein CheW